MDELTRWYISLGLSIGTFIVGILVAFLLYWFEKKRDETQAKQTEDYNNLMQAQMERTTTILETLKEFFEKPPSEQDRQRLAARIERFFPGSVQVGDAVIGRPSLRLAQTFLGGAVFVEALAIGEEGERLDSEISKMKEGKIVNYISPKGERFLAEVKSVDIKKETFDETVSYHFRIELQIKR